MAHPIKNVCLPVAAFKPDGTVTVGTGFLMEVRGRRYFITCGHIAHCANPPSADWSLWTDQIRIFVRPDAYFEVPLFTTTQGERSPMFHYLKTGNTHIVDAIALELDATAQLNRCFFEGFHVSGPETFQLDVGQPVIGYGYPGLRHGRWPYHPPDLTQGSFAGMDAAAIHCNIPIQLGHSGGPLFTEEGYLVGMMIGGFGNAAVIIPRPTLNGIAVLGRNGGRLTN